MSGEEAEDADYLDWLLKWIIPADVQKLPTFPGAK